MSTTNLAYVEAVQSISNIYEMSFWRVKLPNSLCLSFLFSQVSHFTLREKENETSVLIIISIIENEYKIPVCY